MEQWKKENKKINYIKSRKKRLGERFDEEK